jgi:type I restriction enzyme S subunit
MLFVTSENVRDGFLEISDPKYLPIEFHERLNRTKLRKDDILINLVGASIGRSCQILQELGEANVNQAVGVFRVRGEFCPRYVAYCFQAPTTVERILDMQVDAARPNISLGDLRRFPIPLPPRGEREAIADALSDVDALIDAVDKLVAKKRNIKQGAMQELLTGKKRLPGFSEESGYKRTEVGTIPQDWEVRQLGELGTWKGGVTPSMRNPAFWVNGTIPWVSSGEVKSTSISNTPMMITNVALKTFSTILLPTNSILVVTRSGILRKYLPVAKNTRALAINQDIKALLPNNKFAPDYLLHLLVCYGFQILATCLKSGTTVESIEFRWLKSFRVPLPRTKAEQDAIAWALNDIDAEIAGLDAKLKKARGLKQGMMQALLTGRIRLV